MPCQNSAPSMRKKAKEPAQSVLHPRRLASALRPGLERRGWETVVARTSQPALAAAAKTRAPDCEFDISPLVTIERTQVASFSAQRVRLMPRRLEHSHVWSSRRRRRKQGRFHCPQSTQRRRSVLEQPEIPAESRPSCSASCGGRPLSVAAQQVLAASWSRRSPPPSTTGGRKLTEVT